MGIVVQKTVAARNLPESWRNEGRFAPDDAVTVTLAPAVAVPSAGRLRRLVGVGRGSLRLAG